MPNRSTVLLVGNVNAKDLDDFGNSARWFRTRLDVDGLMGQHYAGGKTHEEWGQLIKLKAEELARRGQKVTRIVIDAMVWKRWTKTKARRIMLQFLRQCYPDAQVFHASRYGKLETC